MAERLELDAELVFLTPPISDAARAFVAYRLGLSLLDAFTYAEGWPTETAWARMHGERAGRKLVRKASQEVRAALLDGRGSDAVSKMTQGYARGMAEFWRRSADNPKYADDAEQLRESAKRSVALGELAAQFWPVIVPPEVSKQFDDAEDKRDFDVENPHAMIDLRGYAARARASCEAVAVALGGRFDEFHTLLIGPVVELDLGFDLGSNTDWLFNAEQWSNLISDEPVAFGLVVEVAAAKHAQRAAASSQVLPPVGEVAAEALNAASSAPDSTHAAQALDIDQWIKDAALVCTNKFEPVAEYTLQLGALRMLGLGSYDDPVLGGDMHGFILSGVRFGYALRNWECQQLPEAWDVLPDDPLAAALDEIEAVPGMYRTTWLPELLGQVIAFGAVGDVAEILERLPGATAESRRTTLAKQAESWSSDDPYIGRDAMRVLALFGYLLHRVYELRPALREYP